MKPSKEEFVTEMLRQITYKKRKAQYDADGYRCDSILRMRKLRNRRNIRSRGCFE